MSGHATDWQIRPARSVKGTLRMPGDESLCSRPIGRIADPLRRMGAEVAVEHTREEWEPRGSVTVRATPLVGTTVEGSETPNLIDELPLVATLGAFAEGTTEIRDAAELRHKESDRIGVMVANLRQLGARVDERPDGMSIHGPTSITGGCRVESHGDYRVAMCMAILGFRAATPITVGNIACVATSYPGFVDDLVKVRCDDE